MESNASVKLSKNVMQLQFMRSARLEAESNAKSADSKEMDKLGRQYPVVLANGTVSSNVYCPDVGYTQLQDLKTGRFSFNGQNPGVESIMEDEDFERRRRDNPSLKRSNAGLRYDISDVEMAEAFQGRGVAVQSSDLLHIYTEETPKSEPQA